MKYKVGDKVRIKSNDWYNIGQKEKDVIFKCYSVGDSVRAFFAQFINAKDIIEIIPTKIERVPRLMIVYYDHELRSECSFFCDGIAIESNEK